jgi:transcription elongation factor GreA-like protein
VVAHAFNSSTWEAEAGEFLTLRPAWSTEWVPGQPKLLRETLSQKIQKQQQKNKQTKTRENLSEFYKNEEFYITTLRIWINMRIISLN